ncbi:hypothetical protein C1H46_008577 [Malus baccata]|uniref:ARGOS-like protein n=1 Tax=Malus baccata TaxID=106549 RepID=A0A540N4D3_MALBA|nr:hypothetical protein C1H46_008577 [Malus baccata]
MNWIHGRCMYFLQETTQRQYRCVQSLMLRYFSIISVMFLIVLTVFLVVLPLLLPPLPPPPLVLLFIPVLIMAVLILLAFSHLSQVPNMAVVSV